MSDGYILQMKNITKTFPGVKALSDVTLEVSEATIHEIWVKTARENPP